VLSGCKYSVNMMTERSFLNLHFVCKWFGELCAVVRRSVEAWCVREENAGKLSMRGSMFDEY
jgi:hypothetical protein